MGKYNFIETWQHTVTGSHQQMVSSFVWGDTSCDVSPVGGFEAGLL